MRGGFLEEIDWDRKYREGFYRDVLNPHELLVRYHHIIPKGCVIDIAMGNGRNAHFLCTKGYNVIGLERSREAIKLFYRTFKKNNNVICVLGDAKNLPFKEESVEGITVFYFLLRDIMIDIKKILKKNGIIIYETFLKRQNQIDRWRNPEYLLDDGELYDYFKEFEIICYEELITERERKKKAIARLVGRKK